MRQPCRGMTVPQYSLAADDRGIPMGSVSRPERTVKSLCCRGDSCGAGTSRSMVLIARRQRRRRRSCLAVTAGRGRVLETSVVPETLNGQVAPNKAHLVDTTFIIAAALVVQSLALVGAVVGGFLARKRRFDMEQLNLKLRQINAELRKKMDQDTHVCEADAEVEAIKSYRAALEVALEAPAAPHPVEAYGPEGYSLAEARRDFSRFLQDGKEEVRRGNGSAALGALQRAFDLSKEIADLRAERSAVRVQARAYRSLGDLPAALSCLRRSLELSDSLKEHTGDVDVLGEIADVYADLGDYERAGQYYDKCITAIQDEGPSSMSPYWDC